MWANCEQVIGLREPGSKEQRILSLSGGREFDAIVVGAGPAGVCASVSLAKNGFSVLLLDKATFPRDKVCGDAIDHVVGRLATDSRKAEIFAAVLAGSLPKHKLIMTL